MRPRHGVALNFTFRLEANFHRGDPIGRLRFARTEEPHVLPFGSKVDVRMSAMRLSTTANPKLAARRLADRLQLGWASLSAHPHFLMYIPAAFRVEDATKLAAFMLRHSFATLITHDGSGPFASHLPVLYRPEVGSHGTLLAHMARANPQWQHFVAGSEALVVFHGPHSYISPSWYQTEPAVPTWNYAAVHAYGIPVLITEHERVVSLLGEMVSAYEASFKRPWHGNLPDSFRDNLIRAIVAFEIPVTRLEGKFKLGQNRSAEDIQGVFDALSHSDDSDSRAMARMMRTECNVQESA